jgi:hypothetical protein
VLCPARAPRVNQTPLKLAHFADLNPDCSPVGDLIVRVAKNPEHGVVTLRRGEGYTSYGTQNPRYQCSFRPTSGMSVIYLSNPGYVGPDSLAVDVFGGGSEGQQTYDLTVK